MNLLIFIVSFIGLEILGVLIYLVILLSIAGIIGGFLYRDEDKWERVFQFGKGTGLYVFMMFPYFLAMIALFFISGRWFTFINFPNVHMSSMIVVAVCCFISVYPLLRIKHILNKTSSV